MELQQAIKVLENHIDLIKESNGIPDELQIQYIKGMNHAVWLLKDMLDM